MPSTASTLWEFVDTIVLVAHHPVAHNEHDFDIFHNSMLSQPELTGIVVLAHDSAPPPHQRETIRTWFKQTRARGAVLTDSLLARGGVTALSWFGVPIHAYGRREFAPALHFVGLRPAYVQEAEAMLEKLERSTRAR